MFCDDSVDFVHGFTCVEQHFKIFDIVCAENIFCEKKLNFRKYMFCDDFVDFVHGFTCVEQHFKIFDIFCAENIFYAEKLNFRKSPRVMMTKTDHC